MSTNESAKSWIIRLENRINGIQCNSIGPFQTGPSSATDQLGTGNWINFTTPAIKALLVLLPSTGTTTSTYHSYVLILSRRLLWWLRIFFAAGGCCPQGSVPVTIAVQSSLPIKHQSCSISYPLAPNNSLTAPTSSSGFPYTLYQNQATRFIDCTIEQGLSARQPFRCKSNVGIAKGITGMYKYQTTEGLRLSALDDHVANVCQ